MKMHPTTKLIWISVSMLSVFGISSCSPTPSVEVLLSDGSIALATNAAKKSYNVGDTVELLEVQQLKKARYHELIAVGLYHGQQLKPVSNDGKVATVGTWGVITKVNN